MMPVRVVSVGYSEKTAAIASESIVRVHPTVTLYHVAGTLHRLTVQGDAVVDSLVQRGTHAYLVGMAAFADGGG